MSEIKKQNKYYNLKSDAKSHQMQIIVCVVLIFIIKFQIDAGMSILFYGIIVVT